MQAATHDYSIQYQGRIKLRLIHATTGTIFLPDVLFVDGDAPFWLQPQWVYPPQLHMPMDIAVFGVAVANVHGDDLIVEITFNGSGLLTSHDDHSQVYECTIAGPRDLKRYQAGRAVGRHDGGIDLRLHHITNKASKKLIKTSGEIWGSPWNFQGTKELANCSYAYFTSLKKIQDEYDLRRIAMATSGWLPMVLDQSTGQQPDHVIKVYRESTENRTAPIPVWVPAEHVASSHVWKHTTHMVEYEMNAPWIFRIGLRPGGSYYLSGDRAAKAQPDLKRFDYLVIGDCTTIEGLEAPFDEENTSQTFHMADLDGATVFDYWRQNANQALWQAPSETQQFGAEGGGDESSSDPGP